MVSPALAAGPFPTTRSLTTSCDGGSPVGLATFGLCLRSVALLTAIALPGKVLAASLPLAASVDVLGASVDDVWVVSALELSDDEDEEDDESSLPQPAATRARLASPAAVRRRRFMAAQSASVGRRAVPRGGRSSPWVRPGAGTRGAHWSHVPSSASPPRDRGGGRGADARRAARRRRRLV